MGRTENSLRSHPVVIQWYKNQDPDNDGLDFLDSSVGVGMQLLYMDLMRPLCTICNMKQKWGTPPWVEDCFMSDIVSLLKGISTSDLPNDLLTSEKFQALFRSFYTNLDDLESKKFNGFKLASKRGTYYEKVTKIDDEGNRSKEFIAKGINIPSLWKYAKVFAGNFG